MNVQGGRQATEEPSEQSDTVANTQRMPFAGEHAGHVAGVLSEQHVQAAAVGGVTTPTAAAIIDRATDRSERADLAEQKPCSWMGYVGARSRMAWGWSGRPRRERPGVLVDGLRQSPIGPADDASASHRSSQCMSLDHARSVSLAACRCWIPLAGSAPCLARGWATSGSKRSSCPLSVCIVSHLNVHTSPVPAQRHRRWRRRCPQPPYLAASPPARGFPTQPPSCWWCFVGRRYGPWSER